MGTPNPVQLEVLARAEKRLTGHIARRGIDAKALAICATYERMYDATLTGDLTTGEVDDLTALVDALLTTGHAHHAAPAPEVVSPVLLDNARAERARRAAVTS